MARAGTAAALFLMLAAPLGAQQAKPTFADSVEREFALRRVALAWDEGDLRLERDPGVELHVVRLKAVERRREIRGEALDLEAECQAAVESFRGAPPPELLAALLRLGRDSSGRMLDAPAFEAATAHPLPSVRLAALEGLAPRLAAKLGPAFVRLALDPDERVAKAAVDALCLALPASAPQVIEIAEAWRANGKRAAWFALAARLERCEPTRELLDGMAKGIADEERLAILAALRLRWIAVDPAVAEALTESALYLPEAGRVARAWPGPEGFESLFTAAARASRANPSGLGWALLAELELAEGDFRALSLLRGAIEALPAAKVLEFAGKHYEIAEKLDGYLFQALEVHPDGLTPADLEAWKETEQRRGMLELAKSLLLDEGRSEFGALVADRLNDGDREITATAFEALCDARLIAKWESTVHQHWLALDRRRAEAALAELPRGIALKMFEPDLVRLAESGGSAGMSALELLEPLAPLAELRGIVEKRLENELAMLERSPANTAESRNDELRAAGLVRALQLHAGEACHDTLVRVLERTRERVEVSKIAVWALGQDERGRTSLKPWLGPDVPRRLRVEAALARAPFGDERAIEVLAEDWKGCDFDLRTRALKDWAASAAEAGRAQLARIALEAEQPELLRELALDLLAKWVPAQFDVLSTVAVDRNLDLRRHALLLLGSCDDPRAVAWLRERLKAHAGALDTPEQRTIREMERETIWTALAQAHAIPPELEAQWLAAPLAAAPEQVRARFVGQAQGETEFAWRAELELAEEFARTGRLAAVLDATPDWWTCDARLLASIGQRARAEGDFATAVRLLAAAGVGLLGEAEGEERDARLFDVRCSLLDCWSRTRASGPYLATAQRLLHDERLGRGPRRAFEREFGGFDPARGVDGLARLEASMPQLLARASLERGDRDSAARALERSAGLLGHSRVAREIQSELEALLRR
ncbi:MAG: hypothetical protein NTV21_12995 [Planctomycetota bacterium]|nr:hypothetical protein [Planctomycetota bacterium]